MGIEGKTVLVVDDTEDVREAVKMILDAHDMRTEGAVDGEDGLAKAASLMPDLIILDVQMPKKDGFQTFTELRANEATRSIPVIMITGVGERLGIGFSAREMGEFLGDEPEAYLEKPISPEEIVATVTEVLSGGAA